MYNSSVHSKNAQVVELVDTLASGASDLTVVEVQVLFWAPMRSCSLNRSNSLSLRIIAELFFSRNGCLISWQYSTSVWPSENC